MVSSCYANCPERDAQRNRKSTGGLTAVISSRCQLRGFVVNASPMVLASRSWGAMGVVSGVRWRRVAGHGQIATPARRDLSRHAHLLHLAKRTRLSVRLFLGRGDAPRRPSDSLEPDLLQQLDHAIEVRLSARKAEAQDVGQHIGRFLR